MPQFTPYMLATLLSSVIILAMGICLLTISMPRTAELNSYRISRRLLAVAYIILALQSIAGVFWDEKMHAEMITPLFQAFLFAFALITLLNNAYVTRRRIVQQLIVIGCIISVIILNLYILTNPVKLLSYSVLVAYFGLFAYYVWIFFREYRNYKRRADNFYAGNERGLLRWVSQIFVIAAVIGVTAGILTENNIVFWIFIAFYTFTYTYLAIRYINYVTLFSRIAPAVAETQEAEAGKQMEIPKESIRTAIEKWTGVKGFLCPDVSLESLAKEFYINPTYLSRYINSTYGQNFRSWVNSQRIAEAQRLITEREDFSFARIGEQVGIPSSSTFYRQFAAATGVTPAEYRRRFGRGEIENNP